jgi:hypothetical protein
MTYVTGEVRSEIRLPTSRAKTVAMAAKWQRCRRPSSDTPVSHSFLLLVAEAWVMGCAVATDAMTVTIAARSAPVAAAGRYLAYLLAGKDRLLIVSGQTIGLRWSRDQECGSDGL